MINKNKYLYHLIIDLSLLITLSYCRLSILFPESLTTKLGKSNHLDFYIENFKDFEYL